MDARFYSSEEIDIDRLGNDLVNVYMAQGYQTQQIGNKDQTLVQLKKGGDLEALVGLQAAVSLTIQRTTGGVLAMIGQQKWLDKAAVGTVGIVAFPILWPLALTAGAGALRQASLGNQVLNVVDGLVRQQRPNVQVGPIPAQLIPQVQRQWSPPPYSQVPAYVPPAQIVTSQPAPQQALPAPTTLRCPNCNTPYGAGDTFCSGCGHSLTPQKSYCANCHAELKPGASFCPNCGASSFQPTSQPAAAQSAAPTYTPPPAQPAPSVYTPPPTPPAPPAPKVDTYTAPTVSARPQPAPETYYVPPVTQDPPVQPQPKVTMIPNTPKQETPTAPPQQRPQVQYYTPSTQQSGASAQSAQPAAKPVSSTNPWGTLTFSNGYQVQLTGEQALVGRYDHDLGGDKPAVDLSGQQGADTTSRIHAVIEHVGSTCTLTDLNSTNATRINNKRLEADKPTPINDGDTISFGKVTCTFKKM